MAPSLQFQLEDVALNHISVLIYVLAPASLQNCIISLFVSVMSAPPLKFKLS